MSREHYSNLGKNSKMKNITENESGDYQLFQSGVNQIAQNVSLIKDLSKSTNITRIRKKNLNIIDESGKESKNIKRTNKVRQESREEKTDALEEKARSSNMFNNMSHSIKLVKNKIIDHHQKSNSQVKEFNNSNHNNSQSLKVNNYRNGNNVNDNYQQINFNRLNKNNYNIQSPSSPSNNNTSYNYIKSKEQTSNYEKENWKGSPKYNQTQNFLLIKNKQTKENKDFNSNLSSQCKFILVTSSTFNRK